MTGQPNLGGFHRRIRIVPFPNRIVAGLEDNLHFFVMELKHADGQILDIDARAERYPWSTCIGGPEFLRKNAIGKRLDELAEIDIFQHCTHLFELAVICAGHSGDQKPVQFDLHVDDWIGDRTRVRLLIDGNSTLELDVVGRIIETPGEWAGLDVFEMCRGNHEFDVARREAAMLIGRAIYVSLGRAAPRVERPRRSWISRFRSVLFVSGRLALRLP